VETSTPSCLLLGLKEASLHYLSVILACYQQVSMSPFFPKFLERLECFLYFWCYPFEVLSSQAETYQRPRSLVTHRCFPFNPLQSWRASRNPQSCFPLEMWDSVRKLFHSGSHLLPRWFPSSTGFLELLGRLLREFWVVPWRLGSFWGGQGSLLRWES